MWPAETHESCCDSEVVQPKARSRDSSRVEAQKNHHGADDNEDHALGDDERSMDP